MKTRTSHRQLSPRLCLATFVWAACALAQSPGPQITFASDQSWTVYSSDPAGGGASALGSARLVCLNLSSPQSCPSGSIVYGNPAGGGWSAGLEAIPGALWIWAPNVTGNTARADLKFYYFSKTLELPGPPASGWISVAVDDYAKIYVNGQLAGEYGSITDVSQALAAQSALKTFDIKPLLRPGSNVISVFAQNGPNTFNGCSQCRYSQNSAGVVFGGAIALRYSVSPDLLGFPGLWGGFDNDELQAQPLSSAVPKTFVNSMNGNQALRYRDLVVPGDALRFNFIRYYNSLDPYTGPLGPGWTHAYNLFLRFGASGNVTVKEADGREVSFAPAAGGLYTPVTDGVSDALRRNPNGSFVLTRKNHNQLWFSSAGQMTRITDQNGNILACQYDSTGNLTEVIDPEGRSFAFGYENNRLKSLTDPWGRQLTYGYDADGRLISYSDPVSGQALYSYGPTGQLTVAKQPGGGNRFNSFQNLYDDQGRVISQQNPAGATITAETYRAPWPDPPGSTATTLVDPLGRRTIHVYDSRSRIIRIIDALGGITNYTYDDRGNRTSATDPLGNTTTFTYDGQSNLTSVTDGMGAVSRFTYDGNNNLLSATNGRGTTVTYTYDSRNNQTSQRDALGNTTYFTYDDRGRVVKTVDPNGHTTTFAYDAAGNLVKVTDALGQITRYEYDSRRNRTAVINARGKLTAYAYDSLDRLAGVTDPLGNVTRYGYDAVGNVVFVIDANGQRTDNSYSGLNRIAGIRYSTGGAVAYTYDAAGNRSSMTDSRGVTNYAYDALDRLISVVQPGGLTVRYGYDAAGNRTSVQYPDGRAVAYAYDRARRMTGVTDWLGRATRYDYDPAGNAIAIQYPNGTSASFAFDGADRLVGIANSFQGSDRDSIPLTNFQYTLDPEGNRTRVADGTGQAISYGYDALDQLVRIVSAGDSVTYTYDPDGNRVSEQSRRGTAAYAYDDADRMQSAGDAVFTYDKNGNRLTRTAGRATTRYSYDPANRLTGASAGQSASTFEYDGDGNRVAQNVAGAGRYEYVNDSAGRLTTVLQETGPDGAISYVRGRALISASGSAFEFYYLPDTLRSAVGLTDSSGQRIQRYTYDPWGTAVSSLPSPGVGTRNKFRFTGEALDPETGLYYLRARYYDPETGRFLSKDRSSGSVFIPLSLNPYIYVRNNPMKYVDPSGCDYEPPEDPPQEQGQWPFAPPWP